MAAAPAIPGGAPPVANGGPQPEERRRRVGSILSAYYGIEGSHGPRPEPATGSRQPSTTAVPATDRQGFDARRHFDGIIATGTVADVLRNANELDAEVKDLDGDMQMVIYENYSKFMRATEVTSQVKGSVDGLEPDVATLEKRFSQIGDHQRNIEDGVSGRAREIELLLTRQRRCRKLQALFELPQTLQRCLDRGAYGKACEAYCTCAPFLRQYRHVSTFQSVLEDVELQMGRIRSALELRLRSPELSAREAVNSSTALVDLGEESSRVARDFLSGRAAALRIALARCFAEDLPETALADAGAGAAASGDEADASATLRRVCARVFEQYIPELVDAVDGFTRLQDGKRTEEEDPLLVFVSVAVEGLFGRIAELVDSPRRPPPEALVACVHNLRESLRRLHSLLPRLLAQLFTAFLSRLAGNAAKALFNRAASIWVSTLIALHESCKRSQDSKGAALEFALTEAARIEQALAASAAAAVDGCRPLVSLIASDRVACQQLQQGLQDQLLILAGVFCEVSRAYAGQEARVAPMLVVQFRPPELEVLQDLEFGGIFALSLVWLGRRLEENVLSKVWSEARDLFTGTEVAATAAAELVAGPTVGEEVSAAAEVVLSHYVRTCGQRLAHFLRNSVQRRGWAQPSQPPQEPSLVVEMVFKEAHAFDAQLGRLLGDPRKPRAGGHRRNFNLNRSAMELDIERQWAKKVQVFAPTTCSRGSAVAGILKIAFKGLIEYVREETFSMFGLQQLQVDTELLEELSRDYVEAEDAQLLGGLLSEALSSATKRCSEPTLLEAAVAEAFVTQKKRVLRLE